MIAANKIPAVDVTAEARAVNPKAERVITTPAILALADHRDEATRRNRLGRLVHVVLSAPRRALPDGHESVELPKGSRFVVASLTTPDGDQAVAIVSGWEWALAQRFGGLAFDVLEPIPVVWQ